MAGPLRHPKRYRDVLGLRMAYVEMGEGRPIVFLHGNPTSSYLWRHLLPHLAPLGRCIAPDLVGMGDSDKLEEPGPDRYRFVEHRAHLEALLEGLEVEDDVVLVGHDWGGALAFDWANRHRDAVAGIAYMETIVAPVSWSDWPEGGRGIFQAMRSPAGEEICLVKNVFVERIVPASVLDPLPEEVLAEYRRPFSTPGEGRRPTLTWPREIPIDGLPADVNQIVAGYSDWLAASEVPKLFVNAAPGSILVGRLREICRRWPNQEEVTVRGSHFVQEDAPDDIGSAVASWCSRL